MNIVTQLIVLLLSAVLIGGMMAMSLRSRGPAAGAGPQTFRVHPAWFVFCAVGGVFLVGLFAAISATGDPGDRAGPAWASVIAAVFFVLFAFLLRSISATIDETQLTVRSLGRGRTVALRDIESVQTIGMCVEIRFRAETSGAKPPPPLVFLAALRGLGDLYALIRTRSGATVAGGSTARS